MFTAVQVRCRQIVVNLDAGINEALCKLLCYNICVLMQEMHKLGIRPAFYSSLR